MSRKKRAFSRKPAPVGKRSLPGEALEEARGFAELIADLPLDQGLAEVLLEKEEGTKPPNSNKKKVRQLPPPQEELDLHGRTADEAERELIRFVGEAGRLGFKTVRIITGKGLHSLKGPVLKDAVEARLLLMQQSGEVINHQWEKKTREQSGALLVLLR